MTAPELAVSVQLYGGGEQDGRVLTIPASLHQHGAIQMPHAPNLLQLYGGEPASQMEFRTLTFTWDGTVSEAGHARYRCTS